MVARRTDAVERVAVLEQFGLLRLERTAPAQYRLEVRSDLSSPFGKLYGGVAVAACAEAAEAVVGRPLQWITTQFIGPASPPDDVDFHIVTMAHGRTTTQAQVIGTVAGRPVFTSLCAHTQQPGGDKAQFVDMPDVAAPHEAELAGDPFADTPAGAFVDLIERRWATRSTNPDHPDSSGRGRVALWCRIRGARVGSPATQAFVADIVPLAVCAALGVAPQGASLDNTVRIIDREPSDWVLLDMSPDGFHRATGHGSLRIWSEDGRLMGTAQQSTIYRIGSSIR